MPGRKQDHIWMYFDKDVEIGKSGCKAKCKECGKSMQGIVARMKQHHSECKTDTQDTPAITVSTPRKRPAPEAGESSPLCTPTKRTKISAGKRI